jgi:D-arabinose 1-dehydrogenase-like Zn-dependent alcohol dehydrogenase
VGGDNTLGESIKAVRTDGIVSAVGLVAGPAEAERPALLETLWHLCIVRGVLLGTREQFAAMNAFVEKHGIDIALDDEVFGIEQVKDAYRRVEAQKHFSKVVIRMK